MKLYDCEQDAQEELFDSESYNDNTPVFDRGQNKKYNDFKI